MAYIVPSGSVVAAINGTLDGYVYYRGRYGNTVRQWVYPTNTITPQRTAIRNLFASLVSLYNSLTQDMQNDWDLFAMDQRRNNRLAQSYVPTGMQVFMERNMNLALFGGGPLLLPPIDETMSALISTEITTLNAGSAIIHNTFFGSGATVPANFHCMVYATNNQPPGKTAMTNRYRLLASLAPGTVTPQELITSWLGSWNPSTPISGKRIFWKSLLINDNTGQASAPAYCSHLVA